MFGIRVSPGAIGGTGGCPFAPGSAGNTASEDLDYAFAGRLGLDAGKLVETGEWLNDRLGRGQCSAVMRAARSRSLS